MNDLTNDELLSLTLPASRAYTSAIIGAANSIVTAPDGDVGLRSGGNDVFIGGTGDNTYLVGSFSDIVIEQPTAGMDTIVAYGPYALPDNVENLFVQGNGPTVTNGMVGIGNALNNIITGDAGNQLLDGGFANDILTGGAGNDTFLIRTGQGSDLITDFGNGNDAIRLQGFGLTSFDQVLTAASQVGNDVVIQLPGSEALGLKNVALASLTAQQFQLDLDRSDLVRTFGDEFDTLNLYNATNPGGTWRTSFKDSGGAEARSMVVNGEKQIFTDASIGVEPFSLDNGILNIAARDTPTGMTSQLLGYHYTAGMISSRNSHDQLYGVFEITAKLPAEKSVWPAFWLLPTAGTAKTELDVMEFSGLFPQFTYNYIHSGVTGYKTNGVANYLPDATTGFHTYTMDWEPDTITWYVDGTQTYQVATPADMHQPMYMLATFGIGDNGQTPSGPLNADMQIDSIRAYQHGTALVGTGSNDVFTVTSRDQIVQEQPGGTNNTIYASIDYALPDNVQTLTLTGTSSLHGYANARGSTLIGNDANSVLEGSIGNDLIFGGNAYSTLAGNDGNDTFVPGTTGNTVKGGNGYDTIVLSGSSGTWKPVMSQGTGTVTSRLNGAIETVNSIENVRFDNGLLSFENYGMTAAPAQLWRLYETMLGRAPTASELAAMLQPTPALPRNWTDPFVDGLNLAGVAALLMSGAEYRADTAGLTIAQQVGWLYKAALLAPTDAGGQAYWVDQAAQGMSIAQIASKLSGSAEVVKQHNGVTFAGLFVPDNPASADTPLAPAQQFSTISGTPLSITVSALAQPVRDPGGERFAITNVAHATHGTVAIVGGYVVFTLNASFTGDATFDYTVQNTDLIAATGRVTVHVGGPVAPAYIYDVGNTANRTYDFSGDTSRHMLVAGSGNVTVYGNDAGGGYRLGAGLATVVGGAAADSIALGAGAATVTGGAGADTFTLIKGMIADGATNGGHYDIITDFAGASNGARAGDDVLRLVGFSNAARLTYAGDTAGDATGHIYAVDDGAYHAQFIVHYAHDGRPLVPGDYGFYAA